MPNGKGAASLYLGQGEKELLCDTALVSTFSTLRTLMRLLRSITLSILASLSLWAVLATARAQVTSEGNSNHAADAPSAADAASLQKKATLAQARIHANKDDRDQLMRAVKINEVGLAKKVLLKNGFTAEDLENAKITLRTGGGKGGEDEIEISATCCDPKEITIRRTLDYFTK